MHEFMVKNLSGGVGWYVSMPARRFLSYSTRNHQPCIGSAQRTQNSRRQFPGWPCASLRSWHDENPCHSCPSLNPFGCCTCASGGIGWYVPLPAVDFCLWGAHGKERPLPWVWEVAPRCVPKEGPAGSSLGVLCSECFVKRCYRFLTVKKMSLKSDFTIYPLLFSIVNGYFEMWVTSCLKSVYKSSFRNSLFRVSENTIWTSVFTEDIKQWKGFPTPWEQLFAHMRFWESQFMSVSFWLLRIIKIVIVLCHFV